MFALGIVDRLDPANLTGGKTIAGTGEIEADGTVDPIGGIQQKLVGARRAGATTFLVPAANCAEASGAVPIRADSRQGHIACTGGQGSGRYSQRRHEPARLLSGAASATLRPYGNP